MTFVNAPTFPPEFPTYNLMLAVFCGFPIQRTMDFRPIQDIPDPTDTDSTEGRTPVGTFILPPRPLEPLTSPPRIPHSKV